MVVAVSFPCVADCANAAVGHAHCGRRGYGLSALTGCHAAFLPFDCGAPACRWGAGRVRYVLGPFPVWPSAWFRCGTGAVAGALRCAFRCASDVLMVAGVLYGHNLGILIPARFDYNKSIEILVIVVLGGMGSLKGSVIAATLITLLPEVLRGADNFRMLLYSIVLIVMMLLNASPKFASFKAKLRWENLSALFGRKKAVKQK